MHRMLKAWVTHGCAWSDVLTQWKEGSLPTNEELDLLCIGDWADVSAFTVDDCQEAASSAMAGSSGSVPDVRSRPRRRTRKGPG